MKSYELTYIISTQNTQEKADSIRKELESFIQSKEGVVLGSEKLSIQTLAYPIKKQRSGYFTTLTFKVLEPASNISRSDAGWDKIKEIKEKLEKNNEILRHLILIKKPLKELKGRRIRKSLITPRSKVIGELSFIKMPMSSGIHDPDTIEGSRWNRNKIGTSENKKKIEKIELDEIEKKLDEILNE